MTSPKQDPEDKNGEATRDSATGKLAEQGGDAHDMQAKAAAEASDIDDWATSKSVDESNEQCQQLATVAVNITGVLEPNPRAIIPRRRQRSEGNFEWSRKRLRVGDLVCDDN